MGFTASAPLGHANGYSSTNKNGHSIRAFYREFRAGLAFLHPLEGLTVTIRVVRTVVSFYVLTEI